MIIHNLISNHYREFYGELNAHVNIRLAHANFESSFLSSASSAVNLEACYLGRYAVNSPSSGLISGASSPTRFLYAFSIISR